MNTLTEKREGMTNDPKVTVNTSTIYSGTACVYDFSDTVKERKGKENKTSRFVFDD